MNSVSNHPHYLVTLQNRGVCTSFHRSITRWVWTAWSLTQARLEQLATLLCKKEIRAEMIIPQLRVRQLVREHAPKTNRLSKLRLDLNENIAGLPAELLRTLLSTITPDDLSAYPETYELHSSIARHHNLKLNRNASSMCHLENILRFAHGNKNVKEKSGRYAEPAGRK